MSKSSKTSVLGKYPPKTKIEGGLLVDEYKRGGGTATSRTSGVRPTKFKCKTGKNFKI